VKKWNVDNYNVVIHAEFIVNGVSFLDDNWATVYSDVVNLKGTITNYADIDNPVVVRNIEEQAYEHEAIVKVRLFRDNITREVSIHEAYEQKLEKLIKKCNEYINKLKVEKEVTDGLPDSLIGL
jgi:hypothetical protein